MKLLLLVNPLAGRNQGTRVAEKSLKIFKQHGIRVDTRYSQFAGHLTRISEEEVNGNWDGIIALGGDGTLFEVINGMMKGNRDLPVPMGVIPAGTGNSYSRDLGIKTHDDAVSKILNRHVRSVDLGQCRHGEETFYFINILGFGFVADVVQKAFHYKKWGDLSYIIGVILVTLRLSSYRLEFEVDGRSYERDNIFVEICNSTKTGGDMMMAPSAEIDDGYLDVVILNKLSRLRLLSVFPKIFKGTHIHIPEIETFRAREMRFQPAVKKSLTPDGEIAGHTPIAVSVLPGKIRVFDS
jgi:YegS/Rv2252/BmrU family lipid kinase